MKKFLRNTLVFLFLTIVFAYAYDFIITEGLKKSNYAEFNDWNKIFNGSINSDIIISGSSKAQVQILPFVIDSILNSDSYNLALNGYDFNMQKVKFDAYVSKNKYPKVLVQVVSNQTMQKRDDLFELNQFLPYLNNKDINKATREYIGLKPYDYFFPITRYIGEYYLHYVGFVTYFNLPFNYNKDSKTKGAIAHRRSWDGSFDKFKYQNPNGVSYRIDQSSKLKFDSLLQNLEEENVLVLLVYPPVYYEAQSYIRNRNEIIEYYRELASKKGNVYYLDYSNSELSNERDNFYNSQHLNETGAIKFSQILANDISFYMKNENL